MDIVTREKLATLIALTREHPPCGTALELANDAAELLAEVERLEGVIDANAALRAHAEQEAKDAKSSRDHWQQNASSWKRTADENAAKAETIRARFDEFKKTLASISIEPT